MYTMVITAKLVVVTTTSSQPFQPFEPLKTTTTIVFMASLAAFPGVLCTETAQCQKAFATCSLPNTIVAVAIPTIRCIIQLVGFSS